MIQFSPAVAAVTATRKFTYFNLIEITSPGVSYTFTDYFTDITIGGKVYLSNASLMGTGKISMNTDIDKSSFDIILANLSNADEQVFESNYSSMYVLRSVVIIDNATGQPISDAGDILITGGGVITSWATEVDLSTDGDKVVQLTVGSPVSQLNGKDVIETSDDFMRSRNSSDTAFEQAHRGSRSVVANWGKS